MKIIRSADDMQQLSRSIKSEGKTIGFVPTMGFLHEGHLQLVQKSVLSCDVTVMSIFVNPLQFGPGEDFERYPRDFKRDSELAEKHGVDYLFYPEVEELYPGELSVQLKAATRVNVLCGASRPGHFDGVVTVLTILFNLVMPDKSFFGQKDAQQVAVVQGLVSSFRIPVDIVPVETVRESDGLAKSSRNVYLSAHERNEAPIIYKALTKAKTAYLEHGIDEALQMINNEISKTSGLIDYAEIWSYPDLQQPVEKTGQIIIAAAVKFERARLIDNIIFTVEEESSCFGQ
ncbi:pantoate--beta-alanine ligase [Jeotgalibacillus sp. R-1-5s-1]|uniref:pantoate--beta-alanine ligase n=1 Tax=Jeotgalibacillus sp. R-1-5s-1 TaxID=2555897 RepID=UPI00106B892A|nr:pantoate--beta-alanine ligase [Jeotgalibacillus sp. R-1-5s-1]TFE03233.1 pantoate--beta-alanine ligase [Jeotgalibacillus sp. R-1-5s-1]